MSKQSKPNTPPSMPVLTEDTSLRSSHHRPSLFSPPMSPGQVAMAEAGVAALAKFSVPSYYDMNMVHLPDTQSVIVHALASTHNQAGSQAIIVLHPKSTLPPNLGLSEMTCLEETTFLMTSPKNEPFVMYHQAFRGSTLQMSVTEYLTLLQFFAKEWPRLRLKLETQIDKMQEGNDPVAISSHLSFYSHGCIQFSATLSSRLILKIKADSKKTKQDDGYLSGWLEQRAGNHFQECTLALHALATLSQHTHTIKTLTEAVALYKNRSRKRIKPVE